MFVSSPIGGVVGRAGSSCDVIEGSTIECEFDLTSSSSVVWVFWDFGSVVRVILGFPAPFYC